MGARVFDLLLRIQGLSTVGIRHSKTELELRSSSVEAGSTAQALLLYLGWVGSVIVLSRWSLSRELGRAGQETFWALQKAEAVELKQPTNHAC